LRSFSFSRGALLQPTLGLGGSSAPFPKVAEYRNLGLWATTTSWLNPPNVSSGAFGGAGRRCCREILTRTRPRLQQTQPAGYSCGRMPSDGEAISLEIG
jgi:hypothetical protein